MSTLRCTNKAPRAKSLTLWIQRLRYIGVQLVIAAFFFFAGLCFDGRRRVLPSPWTINGAHPTLHFDRPGITRSLESLRNLSQSFALLAENVVYSRYARVYSRSLRHPDGKVFEYDVWGRNWKNNSFAVVCVVPFSRHDLTFTLVREYNIAHRMHVYSFPQGCVESPKHSNMQEAAEAELDEEARLRCKPSSWIQLLHVAVGSPQDKFQREKVHYYLCSDAAALTPGDGRARDTEEDITIERHVTVAQLKAFMLEGVMQSNNIAAGMLAIDRLRRDGLLPVEA